uniref:U-box domain-containing protein n=1 Tax=Amphora coffeiformis TaxID=265554 RepID=A0A7S3L3N6_9STRA|mmetsp:Transcript_5287/g.10444  ORF Transcript_5287/g.10444 Transcript_5287/m.10444 type:complete len:348 (-) Transcript_5287:91-1134(-)|eukprot:scaffold10022_cov170-Amphora_coffeaeformis.AAC.13
MPNHHRTAKRSRDTTVVHSNSAHEATSAKEVERKQSPSPPKRQKKKLTDDLICPITLELPFQPVFAEDGRIYDKPAIEQHLEVCKREESGVLRSPLTNQPMGASLYPAPQIKNLIESMIENGTVEESLLEAWNKRVKEDKAAQELLKKAQAGDAEAMARVGHRFLNGADGFKKDVRLAYSWCQKAHDAGSVYGTARLGYHLARGLGTGKKCSEGIMYMGLAAGRGSDYAAYVLGRGFAEGKFGLYANSEKATEWLEKCLDPSCVFKNLNDEMKDKAREMIEELRKPGPDEDEDDSEYDAVGENADEEEEDDISTLEFWGRRRTQNNIFDLDDSDDDDDDLIVEMLTR